ncbi:MAG: polysaccharide biosynthesis protein [Bacteroidales bacterium]
MQKIKNGSFLITGGTGSFGKALCGKLVSMGVSNVTIYSRNIDTQRIMSIKYPFFKFISGDINDRERLVDAMRNIDFVIHAAALKDVVLCEKNPSLAAKINITGTETVLDCVIECGVKKIVAISSDKAVNPSGVMGMTKAIMERLVRVKAMEVESLKPGVKSSPEISLVRFGNLTGSSGTVIPLFIKQASEGKRLTVTDPDMTRFLMTPEESADYVLFTLTNAVNGDLFIKKSPSVSVGSIAKSVIEVVSGADTKQESGYLVTGARPGEKKFETMATAAEISASEEVGPGYLRVPLLINNQSGAISLSMDYNSHNSQRMNEEDLKKIINTINFEINEK